MGRILFFGDLRRATTEPSCRTLCCKFYFLLFIFKAAAVIAASLHRRVAKGPVISFHRCVYDLPEHVLVLLLSNIPKTVAHLKINLCWRQPQTSCFYQLHLGRTSSFITMVLGKKVLSELLFSSLLPQGSSFFIPSFLSLSPFFLFWLRCLHPSLTFQNRLCSISCDSSLSISDRKQL